MKADKIIISVPIFREDDTKQTKVLRFMYSAYLYRPSKGIRFSN